MNKPISRAQHGLADYSYIPLVAVAPDLMHFEEEKTATTLCQVLSGGVLLSSLLTRAEWGLAPVIPFKAHLAADWVVGAFTLGAPWLFGFAGHKRARNTFLAMGAFGLIATFLTRPEEMPASEGKNLPANSH